MDIVEQVVAVVVVGALSAPLVRLVLRRPRADQPWFPAGNDDRGELRP